MVEVALISVLVKTAKRSYVASLFCPKEIRRCNDTVLVARVVLTPERIADLKPLRPHVIQFLVRRTYTEAELSAAGLLVLTRTAAALVADEATSCYDTSQACHECGSGWSQSRDLELDHRKLAKRAGLVQIV